jgi:hypothetical protein
MALSCLEVAEEYETWGLWNFVLQVLFMLWIGCPNLFLLFLWRYACRDWCLVGSGVYVLLVQLFGRTFLIDENEYVS